MREPYYCDCEHGGNCTRTTMCATDSALADQADKYEAQIEVLKAQVHAGYEAGWHALRQERDALKAQLKRLQEKPNV
jgi:hypothetical protein